MYPPFVPGTVGTISTVPPPVMKPAGLPLHPPGSSAINELEFEFPLSNAATAALETPICLIPTMPARNELCWRVMMTDNLPVSPANVPPSEPGGQLTVNVVPFGSFAGTQPESVGYPGALPKNPFT